MTFGRSVLPTGTSFMPIPPHHWVQPAIVFPRIECNIKLDVSDLFSGETKFQNSGYT